MLGQNKVRGLSKKSIFQRGVASTGRFCYQQGYPVKLSDMQTCKKKKKEKIAQTIYYYQKVSQKNAQCKEL